MNLEKETFYKNATNKLLKQLDTMKMSDMERHQAKKLVVLFRNSFKSEEVKRATFNRDIPEFTYYSDGFCKASSFAFINATDSKKWKLMYINELWTYGPHFYLMHIPSQQVFDLTADQFTNNGMSVPYFMGAPVKIDAQDMLPAHRFATILAQRAQQNQ
jgi:hypothetical protein